MELVIRDLPAQIWEKLDKKAKASGRTIAAEARAVLERALGQADNKDLDDLQKLVAQLYGNKLHRNEVDEFIAERRREAESENEKFGM